MNQKQRQDQMIAIAARMRAEDAEDMSDAEIERTLSGCCAPTRLIAIAKAARDSGEMTLAGPVGRASREHRRTTRVER